jgi:hypothetical protein
MEMLSRGSSKILLGALKGSTELIRMGMKEGGDLHTILDPRIAETLFKMGKAWEDYPKWPALHVAMNAGKQAHLNAAFFMMNHGADVCRWEEYIHDDEYGLDIGYAPAMVYPLGFGGMTATQSHAALLQRLHDTLPQKFNLTRVEEWRRVTDNPPLVQIPTLLGNSGGLHVLVNDFNMSIDSADAHGVAPLHIAVWRGDLANMAVILSNGANRSHADAHGRTPLHYAAMRYSLECLDMLLILPKEVTTKSGKIARLDASAARRLRKHALLARDDKGRTPLDLARIAPADPRMVGRIVAHMRATGAPVEDPHPGGNDNPQHPLGGNDDNPYHHHHHKEEEECSSGSSDHGENGDGEEDEETGGWSIVSRRSRDKKKRDAAAHDHDGATTTAITVNPSEHPDREGFYVNHVCTQRPVLFSHPHAMLHGNPVWAYWRRPDFLDRYGHLPAKQHSPATSPSPKDGSNANTLQRFIELHLPPSSSSSSSSSSDGAVASVAQATLLRDDISRPSLFDLCGPRDQDSYSLLLGTGSSSSSSVNNGSGDDDNGGLDGPVQRSASSASWHVVLAGEITWTLWPPSGHSETDAYLYGKDETESDEDMLRRAGAQPTTPPDGSYGGGQRRRQQNAMPKHRRTQVALSGGHYGFNVTQAQGQVLYLPHGWVRLARFGGGGRGAAVVASQNLCAMRHTDQRLQPLGWVMYGGEDAKRGWGRDRRDYSKIFGLSHALEGEVGGLPVFEYPTFNVG